MKQNRLDSKATELANCAQMPKSLKREHRDNIAMLVIDAIDLHQRDPLFRQEVEEMRQYFIMKGK